MKKCLSVLAAIVFCALGLASTSDAQMMRGGGPPQFAGVFNPKVGVGAAYEVQTQDGKKTMEMAIVGKETVDGKDAYWWEMAMPDQRAGGEMVFKTLLVMDGENTHASKMIMQFPSRPPMEMPAGMGRGDHSRVPTDARNDAEDLGSESVTVPAGTFTAEHYRAKDGSADTWVAKNAGPYGLVKHQGKDTTMVLTKVYSDYKDKITGTPQPFNPALMGGGQQR
ncbi:MAG: hypothetical protein WCC03_16165 [Candidatus Acidiferrales bacterium]